MRISAQVVDTAFGKPAAGVPVSLSRAEDDDWITLSGTETDSDGRIPAWERISLDVGVYRFVLDTDSYFSGTGTTTAYPEVVIIFRADTQYAPLEAHVAISPYCYTAYLGQVRTKQ